MWEFLVALGQVALLLVSWLFLLFIFVGVPLMDSSPSKKEEQKQKEE